MVWISVFLSDTELNVKHIKFSKARALLEQFTLTLNFNVSSFFVDYKLQSFWDANFW